MATFDVAASSPSRLVVGVAADVVLVNEPVPISQLDLRVRVGSSPGT